MPCLGPFARRQARHPDQGRQGASKPWRASARSSSTRPERSRSARPDSLRSGPMPASPPTKLLRSRPRSTRHRSTSIAQTIVEEARNEGMHAGRAHRCRGTPGEGVVGRVDGRSVARRRPSVSRRQGRQSDASTLPQDRPPGALVVAVRHRRTIGRRADPCGRIACRHGGDAQRTARHGHRADCPGDRRPARGRRVSSRPGCPSISCAPN